MFGLKEKYISIEISIANLLIDKFSGSRKLVYHLFSLWIFLHPIFPDRAYLHKNLPSSSSSDEKEPKIS